MKPCPSCGALLVGALESNLVVDYSNRKKVRWYKLATPKLNCGKCGAELRTSLHWSFWAFLMGVSLAFVLLRLWLRTNMTQSALAVVVVFCYPVVVMFGAHFATRYVLVSRP